MTIGRDIKEIKRQTVQNTSYHKLATFVYNIFRRLSGNRSEIVPSAALRVGDIIEINANQRIPADMLLLYSS